ncbi:asialoglycoprotein receptor 2-like [Patiria miniata]|uniref:C-type lectin domain-containing protein n=1 Tax=Patiria miniata TaxID=46514 RepID=A0A913ZTU4_PATMI|nr:asialoglycoprotein receptor 2-like [Patiria miniata]
MREMMVPKRFIFGLICLHLMMSCTGGNEMCKASIGGRRGACPPTWIQWGGNCYKATTEPLTWFDAKDKCIKMGGALVVPQSQEETDFLVHLQQFDFWINCNDLEEEGTWKCHGTDEVAFKNWETRPRQQPDNYQGSEHCAGVLSTGEWNDVSCGSPRLAICIRSTPQLHF